MTDEIATEIQRRGNISVGSSLDGPKELHDQQRPFQTGSGSYDRVIKRSQELKEKYQIRHGYLPTLTANHVGHAAEVVDEYRSRGCASIYLRYVNRVGRAFTDAYDKLGLSPEAYVGIWAAGLDRILQYRSHGEGLRERKASNLLANLSTPGWDYMCLRRPCGSGLHQVVIDQKGDVYTCDQARSIPMLCTGNIATHSYDHCITSDTAKALRTLTSELLPLCNTCALGPFCGYCVCRGLRDHNSPVPIIPGDFECEIYRHMLPHLLCTLANPWEAVLLQSM